MRHGDTFIDAGVMGNVMESGATVGGSRSWLLAVVAAEVK